jgi:hypothetical protein
MLLLRVLALLVSKNFVFLRENLAGSVSDFHEQHTQKTDKLFVSLSNTDGLKFCIPLKG